MPKIYRKVIGDCVDFKIFIPWTGEPQVLESLESIYNLTTIQSIGIEIVLLEGFGNQEVHQLIYSEVSTGSVKAVKLDGDMIIEDGHAFLSCIKNLVPDEILIYPVFCHIVERSIYGIHFFGEDVRDLVSPNSLFPDKYSCKNIRKEPFTQPPFVSHCRNPIKIQVISFIGHRIRKFVGSKFLRYDYLKPIFLGFVAHPSTIFSFSSLIHISFGKSYRVFNRNEHEVLISSISNFFQSSGN